MLLYNIRKMSSNYFNEKILIKIRLIYCCSAYIRFNYVYKIKRQKYFIILLFTYFKLN